MEREATELRPGTENLPLRLLSAIGIVLVVFGHTGCRLLNFDGWLPYYTFHMPMFFFISGYFYSEKKEQKPLKSIASLAVRLLLPLYAAWLFYLLVQSVLNGCLGCNFGVNFSLKSWLLDPWTRTQPFGFCIAGWFIPVMFAVQSVHLLLRRVLCVLPEKARDLLMLVLYLLLGLLAFRLRSLTGNELLINGLKCLSVLCYYEIGYLYHRYLEKRDSLPTLLYLAVCFCILAWLCFHGGIPQPKYYALLDIEQGYLPCLLAACTCIAVWLRAAKLLAKLVKPESVLLELGRNTYSVMLHHLFAIFVIQGVLGVLHKLLGWFPLFDIEAYKTHIYYIFNPVAPFQLALSVGSIAIVLLVLKGKDRLLLLLQRAGCPARLLSFMRLLK